MSKQLKWAVTFLTVVGSVLLLIILLVVVVDPFFRYHKPIKNFPYVVDDQLSQNPGMAKNMKYNSVILGSSVTMGFETKWFDELFGLDTIKLNYNGAYPKDQANIMEVVFESDNTVETVFLGIDPYPYSANVNDTKFPIPQYLYTNTILDDSRYIFNKEVLVDYILAPLLSPDKKTDLSSVYKLNLEDGHYGAAQAVHAYTPAKIVGKNLAFDSFDKGVTDNMKVNILPFIENNPDTEFVVFYSPYSILFWNDMIREGRLEATIREVEVISDLLFEYDNVTVYSFLGEEEIVTDLSNYADSVHFHSKVNRYMTECFANGINIISEDNLDKELQEIYEMASTYPFKEKFGLSIE